MSPKITLTKIEGKRILDSRNVPTLAVTVFSNNGNSSTFSVPSGASTGTHEAYELRDDLTSHGDVTKAISNLKEIEEVLVNNAYTQEEIDKKMILLDGTENKKRLGGNTLIGVSVATLKAIAKSLNKEVFEYIKYEYFKDKEIKAPKIYANLINGGKHAKTELSFQEYHIVPRTNNIKESIFIIKSIQEELYKEALSIFGEVVVGDEGGYALPYKNVKEPLDLLLKIVEKLNLKDKVDFALDVAASSFYDKDKQVYKIGDDFYDKDKMIDLYKDLCKNYPLVSIEDPFFEEDFESFSLLKSELKNISLNTFLVGDDLTTTSKSRLEKAVLENSIDALIIKPNQIGTITETLETMRYAIDHNIKCIVSHRSGETEDDFISDLAYASNSFGIKVGALGPYVREVKYKRLECIENILNK